VLVVLLGVFFGASIEAAVVTPAVPPAQELGMG
jgi:hypothetical protein